MRNLFTAVVLAATLLFFSAAVAQSPMAPSTCSRGAATLTQWPMIPGMGGAMMPSSCIVSSGPPPTCTNSLDLSKACNSANLDLL